MEATMSREQPRSWWIYAVKDITERYKTDLRSLFIGEKSSETEKGTNSKRKKERKNWHKKKTHTQKILNNILITKSRNVFPSPRKSSDKYCDIINNIRRNKVKMASDNGSYDHDNRNMLLGYYHSCTSDKSVDAAVSSSLFLSLSSV